MKSEVSSVQLKQTRKVSYAEYALLSVVLVIATKFCTLPSVLTGIASSKAVWVAALLVLSEFGILFFATETARCGGLPALELKKGVKIPLFLLLSAFFALKLTAFSREVAAYFALSLFESAPVLPTMILLLVACALLAGRDYMAIGRLIEIFVWLFLFVFLFVVIFTRTQGDLFHAIAMLNPDFDGFGKGIFHGIAWFGDSAIIAFLDLRGAPLSSRNRGMSSPASLKSAKRKILFAAALFSFLMVVIFYAVFLSVYGEAAKMTDYAFIKLSAFKANADELGSADWPVIILWSVLSCLYLALLFLAGRDSLTGLVDIPPSRRKKSTLPYFLLGGIATVLSTIFLSEEGEYARFMSSLMNVVTILAAAVIVGVGIYAVTLRKGEKNETQD